VIVLAVALLAADARTAIGVWQRWAALRDESPARCFAVSQPVTASGGTDRGGAFARVAITREIARRHRLFFRLSRQRGPGAPITLAVGERRFALVGDALTARAADAATDRAIVGAMRGGRGMSVASLDSDGRSFADSYALEGAATAIDAAALGCAGR
jgi:hypothetical protein